MPSTKIIIETLTCHLNETKSLRLSAQIRKIRDGYEALLENENWLAGNVNPMGGEHPGNN